jgi:hypothetical protein
VSAGVEEVLALLAVPFPGKAFDGKVPDTTALPYLLLYFTMTTPGGEVAPDAVDLTFNSDVILLNIYAHNVAGSAAAARNVQAKTRTALLNVRPVVAGRVCHPIRQIDDAPATKDESTGKLIFDLTDVYRLRSVPA